MLPAAENCGQAAVHFFFFSMFESNPWLCNPSGNAYMSICELLNVTTLTSEVGAYLRCHFSSSRSIEEGWLFARDLCGKSRKVLTHG